MTTENRPERICKECINLANKTNAAPVCVFRKDAQALANALANGSFTKETRLRSPKQEFSILKQRAQKQGCLQLTSAIQEISPQIDYASSKQLEIKISPRKTDDHHILIDYLTSKSKKDRNRL